MIDTACHILFDDSYDFPNVSDVSGTIRNCYFEADNQLQSLLLIAEFLWPALLLPVAGYKDFRERRRVWRAEANRAEFEGSCISSGKHTAREEDELLH
ncbi:hypothetical protein Cni_G01969 [Canna indica]|uniref:Uncharacterized protein n=1 Tax=Canna indica TaxID=4628 RepID=A0AAQ3JND5_9LILI|nr:hypothetical protein Cni_G01969 [Canna indica]